MKAKCAKCGKELSLFDKVKLEDGYLCKKCAKEFKKTIDEKKVNFKALSLAELSNKEAAAKKKNAADVFAELVKAGCESNKMILEAYRESQKADAKLEALRQ